MARSVSRRTFMKGAAVTAGGLAVSQLPTPAFAVTGIELGLWPDGPDYRNLLQAEQQLGRKFGAFRERGRHSLQHPLYSSDMVQSVKAGRRALLEINCRVGGSGKDAYISFTRGMSSEFTPRYREFARQLRALPTARGPHLLELQSEANIDKHFSGSITDYHRWCRHVLNILRSEGADNFLAVCSITRGCYPSGEGWVDPSIHDVAGVDGYSKPRLGGFAMKPFSDVGGPCRQFANANGMRWGVFETGCQEAGGSYKADWINSMTSWMVGNGSRCEVAVWNHSNDSEGGWRYDTSSSSLSAFRQMASSSIWR